MLDSQLEVRFSEFKNRFSTEKTCREHLFNVRWPDGFICSSCGHHRCYDVATRDMLQCKSCGHQTSVTAGTLMNRTRIPLHHWFWAVYIVIGDMTTPTAKGLSNKIGLTYHATRRMLNKINDDLKDSGFVRTLFESLNQEWVVENDIDIKKGYKNDRLDYDDIMAIVALFEGSFSIDWVIDLTELNASKILSVFETAIGKKILIRKGAGEYCFINKKQKEPFLGTLGNEEKTHKHQQIVSILLNNPIENDEKILSVAGHLLHVENDLSQCRLLLKAGDAYRYANRFTNAYACYLKILNDLTDKAGEDEIYLYCRAAINSSKIVGDIRNSEEIISVLKNAIVKAEANGMKRQIALLELNLARNEWFLSNYSTALQHFKRGFLISDEIDDHSFRRETAAFRIFYLYYQGQLHEVVKHYETIMQDVEKYPHGHFSSMATVMIGVSYISTGQVTQGFGLVDSIYNYSKEKGDKHTLCQSCNALGAHLLGSGKVDEALSYLETSLQTAVDISAHTLETVISTQLAMAYYLKKQPEKSVGYLKEYLRKARKEDLFSIPYTALFELLWAMELGELPPVGNFSIKTQIDLSIRSRNMIDRGNGYFYKGRLLRREGDSSGKIIQSFENSFKWFNKSGHKSLTAGVLLELSKEYMSLGLKEKALSTKKQVEKIVNSIGMDLIPKELRLSFENLDTDRDLLKEIMVLSQEIISIRDNKELVHHIISKANQITGAERGAIFIIEKGNKTATKPKLRAARNLTSADITLPNFKSSMETIIQVASTGEAQVLEKNTHQQKTSLHSGDIASCICVPMKFRDEVVGVLYLDNRLFSNKFKKTDLEILQYFAAQASIAMDNVSAYEEIKNLAQKRKEEKQHIEEQHLDYIHFEEIVGKSAAFIRVLKDADRVAGTDATVLIQGETGVGKELIARAVHRRSKRRKEPFIRVNCSAFPDTLIASELFGHEKGAFTGATERRLGRFELANKGTLFLDEIGDISLDVQIRLLRVLQSKEFERVGGKQTLQSDFRLVAATNRNLKQLIRENKFREDLFFRLNVFPIHVPPLKERRDDIPLLAQFFLKIYNGKTGKSIEGFSKTDMESLAAYDWPGNVRELENVIERGVILSSGSHFKLP
ncbi:MAG: sigma 54-interacting transcriptional regulator, partial [Deltaproteobacteria bacterium]|nr:sigma 54-interacting transcriptional regulator [Deltaproteobacteria bacterium]